MTVITPSPECERCSKFLTPDEELLSLASSFKTLLCEECLDELEQAQNRSQTPSEVNLGTCVECGESISETDMEDGFLVECKKCSQGVH